jgi:hypothetical protein
VHLELLQDVLVFVEYALVQVGVLLKLVKLFSLIQKKLI